MFSNPQRRPLEIVVRYLGKVRFLACSVSTEGVGIYRKLQMSWPGAGRSTGFLLYTRAL